MTAIAAELDHALHVATPAVAERLERLVRDALALADGAAANAEAEHSVRVERLFAAMDGVKNFNTTGRLTREEIHAR